jgi:hypothetical protein
MAALAGESQRGWGYKRAAKAVLRIDAPITPLIEAKPSRPFQASADHRPHRPRARRRRQIGVRHQGDP